MNNFPTIYFKYHNKNIDLQTYEYENSLINIALEHNNNEFNKANFPNYSKYNCDIIVNSNLYTENPEILSAGGFSYLQAGMILDKNYIKETQGNWNDNINPNIFPIRTITTSGDPRGYYSSIFPTIAEKIDNIPVCFSFPILPSSVDSTQFLITLNNGNITKPLTFTFSPNTKFNEKQCIVLVGYFNNKITSGPNAIYPVTLEIVESVNGKKMVAIGPNGLYDMTGKNVSCSNPYSSSLEIASVVLTKYNLPGIYNYLGDIGCGINQIENTNSALDLYTNKAEYRFRIFTKGGYSPNGISSMLPNMYEKYFYLQYNDPITKKSFDLKKQNYKYYFNCGLEYVEIVGLSDLGQKQNIYNDTYIEDHDNQIDIIVKGNIDIIKNITKLIIPSDKINYTQFYNPGGPGPTPFADIIYTNPSEYQTVTIINNLENPKTVSWINTCQKYIN